MTEFSTQIAAAAEQQQQQQGGGGDQPQHPPDLRIPRANSQKIQAVDDSSQELPVAGPRAQGTEPDLRLTDCKFL